MGCTHSNSYNFRNSHYYKSVVVGKRRVKDGECCALWDRNGQLRLVEGPQRTWFVLSDVRFLDRFIADQNQYLVVKFKNGEKQHIRGPTSMFLNPVAHEQIEVRDAINLNSFETVVVYSQSEGFTAGMGVDKHGVQRHIVHGPTKFIPSANEWLHEFSWHGEKKGKLVANGNTFNKLVTLPEQLYHNVDDVRTNDDAQVCVQLMIFYSLVNLEQMLDSTHDPINDFINAVCADVIKFGSLNSFETFLRRTSELNELESFPVLINRAERIGYRIDKVVFRGYKASEHLQAMHDKSIKARTQLRLDAETAEQTEQVEDMKLEKALARGNKEREIQSTARQHTMEMAELEHQCRLGHKAEEFEMAQRHQDQENASKISFLKGLKEQQVDLTKYLVSQNQRAADRVVRVESDGGPAPNIHFSE